MGTHPAVLACASLSGRSPIEVDLHPVTTRGAVVLEQYQQAFLVVWHAQAQAGELRDQVVSVDDVSTFYL
jgi:hypothetical protein